MTTIPDAYVTIDESVAVICSIGIRVTERQVRRWADKGTIPFFLFEGRRYIEVDTLKKTFRKLQAERENRGPKGKGK
jgi:hypothetical protein